MQLDKKAYVDGFLKVALLGALGHLNTALFSQSLLRGEKDAKKADREAAAAAAAEAEYQANQTPFSEIEVPDSVLKNLNEKQLKALQKLLAKQNAQ